jgi:organic radical activating enzyme
MKINEIFYSVQGEGRNTGRAAVFVSFSKCNLRCAFCDTEFSRFTEMTEEEIASEVKAIGGSSSLVVLTGGEPTLQLTESLCSKLHAIGKEISIETNGTNEVPQGVDYVTCSPKFEYNDKAALRVKHIDELKVVYDGNNDMSLYDGITARYRYLQPCDTGDEERNREIISATVEYVKAHPEWTVSIQTQKVLNIR